MQSLLVVTRHANPHVRLQIASLEESRQDYARILCCGNSTSVYAMLCPYPVSFMPPSKSAKVKVYRCGILHTFGESTREKRHIYSSISSSPSSAFFASLSASSMSSLGTSSCLPLVGPPTAEIHVISSSNSLSLLSSCAT
jgi:hypothetical protein